MKILIGYLIVFVIVFCAFGLAIISSNLIKDNLIKRFLVQIWSLIIFSVVYLFYSTNIRIFNFSNLFNYRNLLLLLLAIIPTVIIVFQSDKHKPINRFTYRDYLEGVYMEIPQRLLSQNLLLITVGNNLIFGLLELHVLLNAILWAQFIIIQELMNKRMPSKETIYEILASVWFSIFVGILYCKTGNILVPMLCHGLERYLKFVVKQRFGEAIIEMESQIKA